MFERRKLETFRISDPLTRFEHCRFSNLGFRSDFEFRASTFVSGFGFVSDFEIRGSYLSHKPGGPKGERGDRVIIYMPMVPGAVIARRDGS